MLNKVEEALISLQADLLNSVSILHGTCFAISQETLHKKKDENKTFTYS